MVVSAAGRYTARGSSIPPSSRSGATCARGARPLTMTEPLVGSSRPRIILIVVDFPAPFGPKETRDDARSHRKR